MQRLSLRALRACPACSSSMGPIAGPSRLPFAATSATPRRDWSPCRGFASPAMEMRPSKDKAKAAMGTAAEKELPPVVVDSAPTTKRPASRLKAARKAAIHLTPTAIDHIRALLDSPTPQLLRIGVRNKGCAGMSYHLEYVTSPAKFDEVVVQDGVRVVIDSKALFSIIGSEMDWQESDLGNKFVFNNPNIKDACGCGESFTV